jgi:hypothetical protein
LKTTTEDGADAPIPLSPWDLGRKTERGGENGD